MKRYDIRAVIEATDLVALVSEYTELKRHGRQYRGRCPFHEEKTPSFYVNPDKQAWYCWGACHTGGNAISFIQRKGKNFKEAIRFLAERAGVPATDGTVRMPMPSQRMDAQSLAADCVLFWREQYRKSRVRSSTIFRLHHALNGLCLENQPAWTGGDCLKRFREMRRRIDALLPEAWAHERLMTQLQEAFRQPSAASVLMQIYVRQPDAVKVEIHKQRLVRDRAWESERKFWEEFLGIALRRWVELEDERRAKLPEELQQDDRNWKITLCGDLSL